MELLYDPLQGDYKVNSTTRSGFWFDKNQIKIHYMEIVFSGARKAKHLSRQVYLIISSAPKINNLEQGNKII